MIVGLGEVLWDVFPDGARFGGAPANFACHIAALGADAHVVSSVGGDTLGDRAVESLQTHGVDTSCVARDDRWATGTVQIELDAGGQARYEFAADTAWDHLEWSERLGRKAADAVVVCFGTLGQRSAVSRDTIRRFVASTARDCLRVFDVNLRQHFYDEETIRESLRLSNVLKLNDDELPVVAAMCGLTRTDVPALQDFARQWHLDVVALTRGAQGALLLSGGEVSECQATEVSVQDTVGAGDAFTATMVLGLLRGQRLAEINRAACRVAAFVCSQSGATPRLPDQLSRPFHDA